MRLYIHIGHTYIQVVDGVTELFWESIFFTLTDCHCKFLTVSVLEAPRLVLQRLWYVLSCLLDGAYKRTLAVNWTE